MTIQYNKFVETLDSEEISELKKTLDYLNDYILYRTNHNAETLRKEIAHLNIALKVIEQRRKRDEALDKSSTNKNITYLSENNFQTALLRLKPGESIGFGASAKEAYQCTYYLWADAKSPYKSLISDFHCVLTLEDSKCVIEDKGSIYGIQINGNRVNPNQKYPLNNGDTLYIGRIEKKFLYVKNL